MSFKEEVEAIENQIIDLNKAKTKILQRWTETSHPIEYNQIIEVNDYAYEGEDIIVDHLNVQRIPGSKDKWEWISKGPVLKKDGSIGKRYGVAHEQVKEEDA